MKIRKLTGLGWLVLLSAAFSVPVFCWAQDVIFFTNGGEKAIYSIQLQDPQPKRLIEGRIASPSPDGRFLAVGDLPDSHVIEILDVQRQKIIHHLELEHRLYGNLSWSPNGRWIAYSGTNTPVGRVVEETEIFLISPDGKQRRQLFTQIGQPKWGLVWSSDSESIFYRLRASPRDEVWQVAIQGQDQPKEQHLFHEDARFSSNYPFFSFSPSGEEIAYATFDGLYVANADGTNHRRVTPDGFSRPIQVDWSTDGHQLVFSTAIPDSSNLHIISKDGGAVGHLPVVVASTPIWVHDALTVRPSGKLATTWGEIKRSPYLIPSKPFHDFPATQTDILAQ